MSTATDDMAEEQELSRLEKLPAELRNRIYSLAVVLRSNEFIGLALPDTGPTCPPPALARTNRNIRKEVMPIYYGENTFAVDIDSSRLMEKGFKIWASQHSEYVRLMRHVGGYIVVCAAEPFDDSPAIMGLFASINDDGSVDLAIDDARTRKRSMCTRRVKEVIRKREESKTGMLATDLMLAIQDDLEETEYGRDMVS